MKTIITKAPATPEGHILSGDLPQHPIIGAFHPDRPHEKAFVLMDEHTDEETYSLRPVRRFHVGNVYRQFRGTLEGVLSHPDLTYLLFDTEQELFAWLAESQPTTGTSKEAKADTFAESLMKSFIAAHETPTADHCPLAEAIKEAGLVGIEQETIDAIKSITGIKPDSKVKIVQIGKATPDQEMDMYDLLRRLIVG